MRAKIWTKVVNKRQYISNRFLELENHANSATIETILKVFNALRADIQFNVRIENRPVQLI